MNTVQRTALTFAFAALLPVNPLAAQGTAEGLDAFGSPAAAAATDLATRSDHAHRLRAEGRFAEARREYAAIARRQQQSNQFAGESLWKLAEMYHAAGELQRAATILDQVAAEARRYGHPDLQARALIEAAVAYQHLQRGDLVLARLQQLQPLLSSPFVSDAVRSQIERRVEA